VRRDESLQAADAISAALPIIERFARDGARRVAGWATIELDRAVQELTAGRASPTTRDLPDDTLLGAHCRLVKLGRGRPDLLLLEPTTEGRLAASLARFGEGPVVLYVIVPSDQFGELIRASVGGGLAFSAEADGPFGRQRLVAGGPPWGGHLCVAQSAVAATIEP
jgi:hypothetical protein